ncbi:unnamed protein product [Prorocentrum cordatum]|uniref:Uncharacterized protein n=1 Tax=Prorocentrum cordatum TaxID=2364126 RepID=A0ABN9VYS9_9DINO|nr:unnamed protein product [Polarella glacialis]
MREGLGHPMPAGPARACRGGDGASIAAPLQAAFGSSMCEGIGQPTAVGLARAYREGVGASDAAPHQAARGRVLCEGSGHPTAVGLARTYREGVGASDAAPHHAAKRRYVCEGIGHPSAEGLARSYREGDGASVAAPHLAARGKYMCEGIGHPTAVGLARAYREGDGASVASPHQAAFSSLMCEGIGHPTAVGPTGSWLHGQGRPGLGQRFHSWAHRAPTPWCRAHLAQARVGAVLVQGELRNRLRHVIVHTEDVLGPPGRNIPRAYFWPMSCASPRRSPLQLTGALLHGAFAPHIALLARADNVASASQLFLHASEDQVPCHCRLRKRLRFINGEIHFFPAMPGIPRASHGQLPRERPRLI